MLAHSGSVSWGYLLGAIVLETALLFIAAIAIQRFLHGAAWRRTLWQATLLGLGLIVAAEVSGVRRFVTFPESGEPGTATLPDTGFQVSTTAGSGLDAAAARLKDRSLIRRASVLMPAARGEAVTANIPVWWPGWFWLAGFCTVAIWMAMARLGFILFVQRHVLSDEANLAHVNALARRMGMRRRILVSETPGLAGPIAFGILRPGISLPKEFWRRFTATQQEAMLAHELAHLAARDPFWHALADALAALLWWHPLVWLARRQLRGASESAADEASLLVENGPVVLAECLVELGGRLTRTRSLGWLGMEGGEFRSGLGRRVKELVRMPGRSWRPVPSVGSWFARSIGVLALVILVLGVTSWLLPREAKADTFRQAFRQSIFGLALAAAQSDPQVEVRAADDVTVTAPSLVEEARFQDYEIRAGDTLSRIVSDLHRQGMVVTQKQMIDANPGIRWNQLRIGQRIRIPAAQGSPADRSRPQIGGGDPAPDLGALHTRWFKIDSQTTGGGLRELLGTNATPRKTGSNGEALLADLRQFLRITGVELVPPKQMLMNERLGQLMVRATLVDLDAVESAVQVLNASPPQLTVEVRLCEFTEEAARELSQDPVLGKGVLGSAGAAIRASTTNECEQTFQAILTSQQYQAALRALEGRPGVDVLTVPKVTTLSGRQAQIKSVNVRYIVTDLDIDNEQSRALEAEAKSKKGNQAVTTGGGARNETTTFQPLAEPFELGPVIDLVPYVGADGLTISMTVITTVKEFVGYENLEGLFASVKVGQAAPVTQVVPLPNFRLRQLVASAKVLDGQTVVLAGGTSNVERRGITGNAAAGAGQNERAHSGRKSLLVFVTPTLIDPAGNRVH